jgi:hypothetical protein
LTSAQQERGGGPGEGSAEDDDVVAHGFVH